MRRALLLCLGIASVTWLGFEVFPGHTYLQSGTQMYVPMLERLDAPGYLSRDLVATHPLLTYTIYDEVTLFLREALRLHFKAGLIAQQLLWRAAGVLGAFLIAQAAGLDTLLAFVIASLLNLGATLVGPGVSLVEYEPVPRGFALGLALLAIGLLVTEKPLLAGLAGGVALLYDASIAAPFWIVIFTAVIFDWRLRALFRPTLTVLLIFLLLLANLAQLQPGITEPQMFFGKLSDKLADLQRYRGSSAWVSLWAGREMWHYLAVWIFGLWATTRIWPALSRQLRWFFVALPVLGILSVPISYILLERLRWSLIPAIQPARELLFTVFVVSLACSIAGARAALSKKAWEALFWFSIVFALPIRTRILELLRVSNLTSLLELVLCVALAALLVMSLVRFGSTNLRPIVLLMPLIAMFTIAGVARVAHPAVKQLSIGEITDWVKNNTWGSSMFLFPDARRDLYPGAFRAESRRAVWVDWKCGDLSDDFPSFASEWWDRWQQTMQQPFSPERLQNTLALPIDYYVLKRADQLADVKPVFGNTQFVIYDARDLRTLSSPLRRAPSGQTVY